VRRTVTKGRRDRFHIITEILTCAIEGTPKTQLMYKAKLSYTQMEGYLQMLTKPNLLKTTIHEKAFIYQTTEKGKSFLERYKELKKLLKS